MMDDLFTIFVSRLATTGVEYMVTGSVAAMAYGEPRLTHDIDLVIALAPGSIPAFAAAFPDAEFYCAPVEVIRVEVARRMRGHFNVIHHESGLKADVYLVGEDPLHAWAMARRVSIDLNGLTIPLAPPEYVIVRKLDYFREAGSERHLRDIRGMLRHSGDRIDRRVLREKINAAGLNEAWASVGDVD